MAKPLRPKFYVQSSSRKGQAIIEAVVAITVLSIGLIGILTLLNQSLSLNRVASDSYVASALAAEGVETVKNNIDHNIILNANGIATPWNQGVCNYPGQNGSFEVQYNTTDMSVARIGDTAVESTRVLRFDPVAYYQYDAGHDTRFVRTVKVDCNSRGGEEIIVNSIVAWTTRGGATFKTNVEDHFFHWR